MLAGPISIWRRKAGSTQWVAAAYLLTAFTSPVNASDAELRQLLNRQGCTSFSLTETRVSGGTTLYKVNCYGSTHRKLDVVCKARTCRLDESEATR